MNGAHERQEGRKARQKAKSKRQKAALGRARPLEDSREKGLCILRVLRGLALISEASWSLA
jgi:hypothetical protein